MQTSIGNGSSKDILYEGQLHWSYGLISKAWGGLLIFSLVLSLFQGTLSASVIPGLFLFGIPTFWTLLKQKNFRLYLTRDSIVHIEGALSKKTRTIPFVKVNDVITEENAIFKESGNLSFLTGNEKARPIKGLEEPEAFRDKLYALIQNGV